MGLRIWSSFKVKVLYNLHSHQEQTNKPTETKNPKQTNPPKPKTIISVGQS